MKSKLLKNISAIGLPRIIIAIFLLSLYIVAPFAGINISTAIQDTFIRIGMNIILVLSLIPMIQKWNRT